MPEGFFAAVELPVVASAGPREPLCGACGLYKGCRSPKMAPHGHGGRGILVIGEAPGETEDDRGRPFVGKAGRRLRRTLAAHGIDLDRDCWTTNSIACRPKDNRTPSEKEVEYCRPAVFNAIKEYDPSLIILLGNVPVASVIGKLWGRKPGGVVRWAGFRVPAQNPNAWVCPTFHPSFVEREDNKALDTIFSRQLGAAVSLAGRRPWKKAPDFAARVKVCLDDEEAAEGVKNLMAAGGPLAFDYETYSIKPDSSATGIAACSLSDGKVSVAFPWRGEAVKVFKQFLKSSIPKIAANGKFEDRWSRRKLGIAPRNWLLDTVVAAHVLDNRKSISGLKFQSFARLGQPEYDRHVGPYLKAKRDGGYELNRVRHAPLRDLLLYCGMDSLLEALLAKLQMRDLGITP